MRSLCYVTSYVIQIYELIMAKYGDPYNTSFKTHI